MNELLRISVRVAATAGEAAVASLLELSPGGLEQVDLASDVELAVYGDEAQAERIRTAFPGAVAVPVRDDWATAWRAFHRPVEAAGLWIGPPWETPPAEAPTVVIDPGRAFGTGAHATTRLCVELLAALDRRGSLLDAGCGSGVLSVVAARLGFSPLVAVDVDPSAVEATEANAAVNGVVVDVRLRDAAAAELPVTDVAVANIELVVVERLLPSLPARLAVTSGYLAADRPEASGWKQIERRELDGWAADVLERL